MIGRWLCLRIPGAWLFAVSFTVGCQMDYRKSSALVVSQELAGQYAAAASTAAAALEANGGIR